jgi:hypothetical protein
MTSRRQRKRYRRLAAEAGLRGDRIPHPDAPLGQSPNGGFGGSLYGDWATASRSDLLLLRKAIKEGWPVPLERRRPLMEAALSPLSREDTPVRKVLAIARLAVAADRHDLEEELAEAKLRALPSLPGSVKPPGDARPAARGPAPAPRPIGLAEAEGPLSRWQVEAPDLPEPADGPGTSEAPPDAPAPPEGPGPVERQGEANPGAPGPALAPAPPVYFPFGRVERVGPFG